MFILAQRRESRRVFIFFHFCSHDLVRNMAWTTDYLSELLLIQTNHIRRWNYIDSPAVPSLQRACE